MSKPGPKPKPTALKVLDGNPGRRPLNANEPPVSLGVPECPDWLSDVAKQKWFELISLLDKSRLMAREYATALALACEHYATAREAAGLIQEHGVLVDGRDGEAVKNPACQIFKDNSLAFAKYMVEFGLSPSSRSQLKIPNNEPDKPEGIRRYLGRKKEKK